MKIWAKLSGALFLMLISGCLEPGDEILKGSNQDNGIIFVRIPTTDIGGNFRPDHHQGNLGDAVSGTNIYKLSPASPQGDLTNLTEKWTLGSPEARFRYPGAAMDPELSRDNSKLLFSMKEGSDIRNYKRWHIYELQLETGELTQLTGNIDEAGDGSNPQEGDNFDPYYLDESETNVVFTSTRTGIVDEYERRTSPLLHVGTGRGASGFAEVTQYSFNQSFDQNPMVHSSGKIYFCRWEHLGDPNKMPIFTINPDGTGLFVLYGNHSPRGDAAFLDMAELRDGRMVVSVMERGTRFAGGAVGIIDISKSDNALTYISPGGSPYEGSDDKWVFTTPRPMIDHGDERIIVAGAQGVQFNDNHDVVGEVNYGLYVLDKDGGSPQLIWDDPNSTDYDPIPIQPANLKVQYKATAPERPLFQTSPFVPPELIDSDNPTGYFFTTNVNLRAPNDGQEDDIIGRAKYLRLLEAIPLPSNSRMRGGSIGNTNLEKQRVLGYGTIRDDGSFAVEVPANVSMHMQVLDENGLMLVNQRTWVQVLPGERRVCTGCHASHENDRVITYHEVVETTDDPLGFIRNFVDGTQYEAAFNNAEKATEHPSVVADTLDFANRWNPDKPYTVQAALDNSCVACHNAASPGGGLNLAWNQASDPRNEEGEIDLALPTHVYETLHGEDMEGGGWVTDDGARESRLMWVLFNRNLERDEPTSLSPTYDHSALWTKDANEVINPFLPENRDLLTLIEWIDGGTQYSNSVHSTEYSNGM